MSEGEIELLEVILVIAAVTAVIWRSVQILVLRLYSQLFKKRVMPLLRWDPLVLAAAPIIVICFLYALLIEPFWPEVTHITLHSAKIPPDSKGIRIAHISDVHSDAQPRLEEKLLDIISGQHPDLILFTGDSANSPAGIPTFRNLLELCSKVVF